MYWAVRYSQLSETNEDFYKAYMLTSSIGDWIKAKLSYALIVIHQLQ